MEERNKTTFERYIQPILMYIGSIGAGLMVIAYIVTVFVLIKGFEVHKLFETTIFAIVNAIVGFIIMQFLKIQGQSFAEHLPENQKVLELYYNNKTKDKKSHNIKWYWWTSIIKDIVIKVSLLAITTIGMIYLVVKGSNDWNMLSLACVNLIMFICFGLLSLSRTYDFYNNQHIPYIKEKLKEINIVSTKKVEEEKQEC